MSVSRVISSRCALLLALAVYAAAQGFHQDEQNHVQLYYRKSSSALCYSTSIVAEIQSFVAVNYSINSMAASLGLNPDNLPHPDRLRHSFNMVHNLQIKL